jgi:hypothetical protein
VVINGVAFVHFFEASVLRDYYNRARVARTEAGLMPPPNIGLWLSLYRREDPHYPYSIGQGFGIDHPAVQKVPLSLPIPEKIAQSPQTPIEPNAIGDQGKAFHDALDRIRLDQIPVGGAVTLRRVAENRVAVEIEA